ncbi:MAG: hypothetical protein PHW15_02745 [Patescibacteria group bacterium]|nr:hypothetical protein [Patescibacteria group bacterium]
MNKIDDTSDDYYLNIQSQFYVNEFKKHRVYLGLIKRMELQHASAIQIRRALEKELNNKRSVLNDSPGTSIEEGQDNLVKQK